MVETQVVNAAIFTGLSEMALVKKEVRSPRLGEVLLDVKAEGVCGSDLHYYHISAEAMEAHTQPRKHTTTPGHEIAGIVESVGEGVSHLRQGDRVAVQHYSGCGYCLSCRKGWDNHCQNNTVYSLDRDGGYQDKVIVDARDCVALPEELSFGAGAFLACGASTAYQALHRADIPLGGTVAIVGLGPVGLAALAWAKAMGVRAFGIDPVPERLEFAASLGFKSYDSTSFDITSVAPDGVDSVIDTSGNIHGRRTASRIAKVWGTVVLVGFGPGYDIDPVTDVIMRQSTIKGSFVFSMPVMMEAVADAVRLGLDLEPILTVFCRLEDAPAAVADFAAGSTGKTTITWP